MNKQSKEDQSEESCLISKRLLRKNLKYLESIDDRGPQGEGWKSNELIADINEIREALGIPKMNWG